MHTNQFSICCRKRVMSILLEASVFPILFQVESREITQKSIHHPQTFCFLTCRFWKMCVFQWIVLNFLSLAFSSVVDLCVVCLETVMRGKKFKKWISGFGWWANLMNFRKHVLFQNVVCENSAKSWQKIIYLCTFLSCFMYICTVLTQKNVKSTKFWKQFSDFMDVESLNVSSLNLMHSYGTPSV